jgi:EAL domain-containing protein (putative c-di-GMP-specific phosphodiesterase class I)/ActR/RegA family two-component response regulator
VLILEDDDDVGKIIKRIAESSGYEAHLISDPELFFGAVEDLSPALILLDLMVPYMDGTEILTALARRSIAVKIIITSGMGERALDSAGRAGIERGLDIIGLLAKPFSTNKLRELLIDALASLMPLTAGRMAFGSREEFERSVDNREAALSNALEHSEINLAYRPKIECLTGRLVAIDAVAEWSHPRQGIMVLDQFMPGMDGVELIGKITDFIFDQALSWFAGVLADFADSSWSGASLTINVSTRTLGGPQFIEAVCARCRALRLLPQQLVIELSEADIIGDPPIVLELTTRVREQGFRLCVCDYGTGHMSIRDLAKLQFSEIKADRSLVMRAHRSAEARAVLSAMANLGRSLGFSSTADGVEDTETLQYLRYIGFDLAQGRLIAPPMDGATLRHWASGQISYSGS